MKKIIILVAMLLLGVNSINAARRAVYLSSSIFTAKPSVESTPFGLNYYFEENPSNQQHSNFAIDAQNWIEKHLGISNRWSVLWIYRSYIFFGKCGKYGHLE